MKKITLQAELGQQNLDNFFNSFQEIVIQLNGIIENKNGKKNAISIVKKDSVINLSYERTSQSNGMFLDVTIRPEQEFDERLEWAIQFVFNACRDNDCYELVRVYGGKERGLTMGFQYSIEDTDYDCVLWERPEVVYIIMRHAEPTESAGDITAKGYQQAKEVANKVKKLFPQEEKWEQNSSINLPSGVLRITLTAQEVGNILGSNVDNFNIERCSWLGLGSLGKFNYGAYTMCQNTDYKYQFMFTHFDVAEEIFPTFVKELKLKEDLTGYRLGLAECVVMHSNGDVVKIKPDVE